MKKIRKGFYISLIPVIICLVQMFLIDDGIRKTLRTFSFVLGFFIIVFIFDFCVRKNIRFKVYFLSNPLTRKRTFKKELNFSKDILFHKLIEVLQDAGFKIIQTNENKGGIFAITSMRLFSAGENIYIQLKEINCKTTIEFLSIDLSAIQFWDNNRNNYEKMLEEFEKSLTI